ncbi:hypothetical protein [Saccharothrix lopnurensis]|uniref:Penicillin-binding protein n=1 Tax=Saccharothrix lopnurensis TaxID=1670621 RepID=A0ABW1NZT9_9PSEU
MSEQPPAPEPRPAAEQPPPPTAPRRRFGRVVRHRATQLVAVGLLGLVLGGGLVALLDRDHHRFGNADRPGTSRFDDRGPGRGDFDRGERGEREERGQRGDRGDRPDRGDR